MFATVKSRMASSGTMRHTVSTVDVAVLFIRTGCRGIHTIRFGDTLNHSNSDNNEKKSPSTSSFGVFKESESDDVDVLVNNFTAPALARALRERETTLHNAARLIDTANYLELEAILRPFLKSSIDKRRNDIVLWDISNGLTRRELILVQRQLHRMPREVFQATSRRASVVIPLCNVSGKRNILLKKFESRQDFFFVFIIFIIYY